MKSKITMQERNEARNIAQWQWLFIREEPLAGHSSLVKVLEPVSVKVARGQFVKMRKRAQLRARMKHGLKGYRHTIRAKIQRHNWKKGKK